MAHVISKDIIRSTSLDTVGNETEDGTDPQQHGETSKELLQKLDPFGHRFGRCQGVGTVSLQISLGRRRCQSLFHSNSL